MEDPEMLPNPEEEDEAERRRRAEEAMEQMLLAQEEEEEQGGGIEDDTPPNDQFEDEPVPPEELPPMHHHFEGERKASFSYIQTSFFVAIALIYYALRSRQQWYLALVFLSSSKWAYVVLGNALVAFLIWSFQLFTRVFMNGLRLAEAEGLGDFFRWNITETCLALTMFRSELNVQTGIFFLILVLAKCLHWVADMREGHLRMTEEAIVIHPTSQWPALRWPHVRLLFFLLFLQLLDILAVVQCGHDILQNGPSVSILFAFEGAILLVSVISNILLWYLHVLDGMFHYWHETTEPTRAMHRWIHPWKDHKATLVFAVEVQAQAAKFLFYVTFFAIVMTYYGMPINLFREVYLSFQSQKQRLIAFSKYRQLMADMNRFASPTAEELEEDHVCIICRDEMMVETTKRLPGCGHLFHKSCLREWLVQQQSCPTCRGDISAMEARQRQQDLANERQREFQERREEEEAAAAAEQEHGESHAREEEEEEETNDEPASQKEPPREPTQQQQPRSIIKDTGRAAVTFSDDVDKKPAARTIREKRVRIVSPPSIPQQDFGNGDEAPAFPAFYRAVQDQGASVYNNGDSVSFVIRLVPFGVIILGQELAWRDCDGEKRLMLRMPDGWVCDDAVERIVAVPLEW
jgi:E3 ubiquitin-protein ligase synoviolin